MICGLTETFLTLWQEIARGSRDGGKVKVLLFCHKTPSALRDVLNGGNCLRYGILKKKKLNLPFHNMSYLSKTGNKNCVTRNVVSVSLIPVIVAVFTKADLFQILSFNSCLNYINCFVSTISDIFTAMK